MKRSFKKIDPACLFFWLIRGFLANLVWSAFIRTPCPLIIVQHLFLHPNPWTSIFIQSVKWHCSAFYTKYVSLSVTRHFTTKYCSTTPYHDYMNLNILYISKTVFTRVLVRVTMLTAPGERVVLFNCGEAVLAGGGVARFGWQIQYRIVLVFNSWLSNTHLPLRRPTSLSAARGPAALLISATKRPVPAARGWVINRWKANVLWARER